jgi:hypothetical protein
MTRRTIAPRDAYRHPQRRILQVRNSFLVLCVSAGIATYLFAAGSTRARHPIVAVASAQTPSAPAQGAADTATFTPKPEGNLLQIMRGVMFPESNVIFAGQNDVGKIPLAPQPALSPNLLTSVFGGWQAVENSSLALAETVDLLALPGRMCANGKPVPVEEAAWVKYVNGMRTAALEAYKAAQTKNTDDMVDAAGDVSEACMACHNVYRSNRTGLAGRCTAAPPPPTTPQNPAANLPPA